MSKNVDNILHPYEALSDYKKYLLELYVRDYGEEYYSLIKNRMDSALYIFDSNPIETMNFIRDNIDSIGNSKLIRLYEREYEDYCNAEKRISERIYRSLYSMLSYYFGVKVRNKDELFDLDMDSFSFSSISILKGSNDKEKEEIEKRQEKYLKDCRDLGVNPITNPIYINTIEREKERLEVKKNIYLLRHTKWGRRITKMMKSYDPKMSIEEISIILNSSFPATTNALVNNDGITHTSVTYCPIIRDVKFKCLDRLFFHENRHVIETGIRNCGVNPLIGNNYSLINELHTEDNAILDSISLSSIPLWSNDDLDDNCHNAYEEMFPYTDYFFEDNRDLLNSFAISGDIASFEEFFGKSNLSEFEKFLFKLHYFLADTKYQVFDEKKAEEGALLVKKMKCK